VGAILGLVTAGLKGLAAAFEWLKQKALNQHDDAERRAGADAQARTTQDATIASLERQNQAAVDGPKSGDDAGRRLKEGNF
jgi:hypothetical protein